MKADKHSVCGRRFAFFVAATFAFIVLFEHGTSNFADNAKKEIGQLQIVFGMKAKEAPKKDAAKPLSVGALRPRM